MRRSVFLTVIVMAASVMYFAAPAMAQGVSLPGDETIQIRADYWLNELNAEVKITSGVLLGTSVNAFDTLGMDVHQQTVVPMIISYSRFGFKMEFWRNTYTGDKNLDEPVIFNGTLYPAGDHLQSKLVIDNYDLRMFVDLATQKKLDLYPMAGIRYQRYQVWLNDLTTGDTDEEILHLPLPYVGAGVRFNVSQYVSFGGELGIMNITFSDYDLQIRDYMDFHAYIEIHITPNLAVVGGIRYLTFRLGAKKDDMEYQLNEHMEGLFVGAVLMF